MQARIQLTQGLLGAALALLVLCIGLWRESLAPALPGANPRNDTSTMVADFGFASPFENRLPLHYLESLTGTFNQWSWSGSMSHRRPIQIDGRVVETQFELVFGSMFDDLGVVITGRPLGSEATRLPLSSQPVREMVLGHELAARLFSSPDAAVGKYLNMATMSWAITGEGLQPYLIVGVAKPGFVGANIEVPAQLWIGINGWQDVLFPAQQVEDLRRHFGPSTVLIRSDDRNRAAQAISTELQRLGEPAVRVSLIPGAGYHPVRRDRFARISEGLLVGIQALIWTLAVCVIAMTWLQGQRSKHASKVRRMLGEPVHMRLARQARTSAATLVAIALGFVTACVLFYLADGRGIPIRAALFRGLGDPLALTGISLLLASLALAPIIVEHVTAWAQRSSGRFVPSTSQALFAILLTSTSITWFAGMVSVERLLRLGSGDLSDSALMTGITRIESDFRRYLMDDSNTKSMEELLAGHSIALASTGPLGAPIETLRGSIESPAGVQPAILPINHVSHNYFDVTGMTVHGACTRKTQWNGDVVLANEAFVAKYFNGRDASEHRLTDSEGRVFQVCGTAKGAHTINARAGSAPMLYTPLTERRRLRVAVTEAHPDSVQLAVMSRALDSWFPDAYATPSEITSNLVAAQLKQERDVIALNWVMMAVSGLIGFGAALLLGRATISTELSAIATRRALGASTLQLMRAALLGRTIGLWCGIIMFWIAALIAGIRVLDPGAQGAVISLMAALTTPALLTCLVLLALRRDVSDTRLVCALRAE